ncbi:hypothetical protein ARAM_002370 [Aspergillus rambellii]|uniref:G-protein coupled receptors family 2 profile 2 domain-containing protein n=1 Tax=Aspergillus rambellii TaxID=308745 RepID=A0A0F8VU82_9EURO|nr:hypothetical protein ARAM_002370 [Aspergillus rambellii]
MSRTDLHGECQIPFYQEDLFPSTGGFIGGRFCQQIGNVSCCVPCPFASWTYGEGVQEKSRIASWLSVAVLPLCIFLLVSYAVLPAKRTHRHYLSICFTLGICCMQIAFIIPLGVKPEQCHNIITPNDMYSSLSCAFTGAMLLFGGWVVVVWSFIRTIAFHLQVCWEVIIGTKFMWGSFICGWGIPIIGTIVMLTLTGVSYRFGEVCHINIQSSLHDYWIPIMIFATAALFVQFATMGYCVHVYIKSLFDTNSSTNSSGMPSYSSSIRTVTARQAYRRIRKILKLQWRSNCLVVVIIANVIVFAVIFMNLDNQLSPTAANTENALPWLLCLVEAHGDRTKCFGYTTDIGPTKGTLLALLVLLSLVGLWNFVLFARGSMFVGWIDLITGRSPTHPEFVSADARNLLSDKRTYEMLNSNGLPSYKTPDPVVRSPSPTYTSRTMSPDLKQYGRDAKYVRPSMSFSGPRPPSASQANAREWDPQSTFAQGRY